MGHGLDTTVSTGGAFAAKYLGGWHDLGVVTQDPNVGALQLLQMAHGDYPIFALPIEATWEDPDSGMIHTVEDDRRVNIMRLHPETKLPQILGQGSPDYPLWTPRQTLVEFGDGILQYGEPTTSTAGVLYEGRQAFMSFELPEPIKIGGDFDEQVRLWLVIHTSFDQSMVTTARITPIRPVCANTLRMGVSESLSCYKVKKTKHATLDDAKAALKLLPEYTKRMQVQADALLQTKITNAKFEEIITAAFGPGDEPTPSAATRWDKTRLELMNLFTTADTQANARGTAWAAFNAVAEKTSWHRGVHVPAGMTSDGAHMLKITIEGEKTAINPQTNMLARLMELASA